MNPQKFSYNLALRSQLEKDQVIFERPLIAQQVRRHQTEYLLLVNLVSKYVAPNLREEPKQGGTLS